MVVACVGSLHASATAPQLAPPPLPLALLARKTWLRNHAAPTPHGRRGAAAAAPPAAASSQCAPHPTCDQQQKTSRIRDVDLVPVVFAFFWGPSTYCELHQARANVQHGAGRPSSRKSVGDGDGAEGHQRALRHGGRARRLASPCAQGERQEQRGVGSNRGGANASPPLTQIVAFIEFREPVNFHQPWRSAMPGLQKWPPA